MIPKLDPEALALFARKGLEAGPGTPQVGKANGVKVRRVMQVTQDLAGRPFAQLRVLDLGCGEGVYAIEAGLRGADVLALDARSERLRNGAACAKRHGLDNVSFRQQDVREVSRETHGTFDVVYCLGLLYHLDAPDLFSVLENINDVCRRLLIVDTLITFEPNIDVAHRGRTYEGRRFREHADDDPDEVRRARLLRSIDNTFAFRFAPASLVRALGDAGFAAVLECHLPAEPLKPEDRLTLAALQGKQVRISTYPWVNDLSELEIKQRLERFETQQS